jgi:hypothetical protein
MQRRARTGKLAATWGMDVALLREASTRPIHKMAERCVGGGSFEKPSARFPLMIFTTEILKMNPDKGAQWCKDLATISSTNKAYVGWSFYNSNIPAAEQCVQTQLGLSDSDVKKIMSATRYDPLAKEPSTPADLDMLWAVFSATGNEAAVNKIIDVLARPSPEKNTEGSVKMLLMKGAAKWSLTSNIQQHTRVAGIVQKRRVTESGVLKKSSMKQ